MPRKSLFRRGRSVLCTAAAGLLTVSALATPAAASAASPDVSGPVSGGTRGHAQTTVDGILDLAGAGYVEQEFFLEGSATAYAKDSSAAAWGADGAWSAVSTGIPAPYKTRIMVRRPADPARFNGTVVVEWMNVTGQADGTPDFLQTNKELLREGYAWVGVSAQQLGVQGFLGLKNWDPTRYGSLSHPGDSYSYDIFSQAGQALRTPSGVNPLGALQVKRLIADGESQSAQRMVTYINAVHPLVHVYDGFYVHSRSAGGSALSQAPQAAVSVPLVTQVRTDLTQPVLMIQNETDLPLFRTYLARQADTATIRTWEIAGTSHFDQYGLDFVIPTGARDFPQPEFPPLLPTCQFPANNAHARYVLDAGLHHLNSWVQGGPPPPAGAPITMDLSTGLPVRDGFGNALGGIRLPELDVPVATLAGIGNQPAFCVLFGITTPLPAATLATLYPNHGKYVSAFSKAVTAATAKGFLLPYDAAEAQGQAAASKIGK